MNKTNIIVLLFMISAPVFAQSSYTIMSYHLPINYKNSGVRENSSLTGIYGKWEADLNNAFELAVDYSSLNYIFDFHIDQVDYTFVYNNSSIPEWNFRAGAHYIVSDDVLTDKSYLLFAGVGKSSFRSWDTALNIYYSNYSNYTPSFSALQLSPNFGLTFMFNRTGGIHLASQADFILLSEPIVSDKDNYFSFRETVTYFNDNFSISAYAIFGEQKFGVRQNGFLVYNVADLMKTGFGAYTVYSFSRNFFLKGGVEYDKFDEEAYGTSANSTKFVILAGFNF